MQNYRNLVLLPLLLLLAACGAVVRGAALDPASGPLFDGGAGAIQVFFSGATTGSGTIHLTLPGGESVRGEYRTLPSFSVETMTGSEGPGVTPDDWEALFGRRDATAGQIYGEALCQGDRGTVLHIQYIVDPFYDRGLGVAKDNRDNLYRLRF